MRRIAVGAWVVAGLHVLLLLALAGRYGFHRDELYFLEAGHHLALGYVDQPPLVPALARAQELLFGASPAALRVVPAFVSGASVLLGAALARELGGRVRAQVLGAVAVAGAGFVLATGHLLSTATIDFAFWVALLVVLARLLRTDDPRWWVAYGAVAGLALWNKDLVVLLSLAVAIGLVIDRRWRLLRSPWLAAGAGTAVLLAAPVLVWQATHGWPQLQMAGALADRIGAENRALLLPLQLVMLGPLLLPLGWVGVRWLLGRDDGQGRTFRPLLWAYLAALVLTFASGGRPYYPLPLAAAVVIAGVVAVEDRWRRLAPGLLVATALIAVPLGLPVLPVSALGSSPATAANEALAEMVGWRRLVDQVAQVVEDLPPDERDGVVLLAASYGEAGALDRYGPSQGLPEVYSGHNSYWYWRRPHDDQATVVTVRFSDTTLAALFEDCELVARVDNGYAIDNEAQGQPIHVCRGRRGSWAQRWEDLRNVS